VTGRTVAAFPLVLLLAAATGYVSLSQEILWVRAIGYATGGRPQVFGHVLGFFLIGIAFGALLGKWVTRNPTVQPLTFMAGTLFASALVYYVSFPVNGLLITWSENLGLAGFHCAVALVAFLIGGVFPVLCHTGIQARQAVGVSLSRVYVANIVGSTAGPLLTGFVLLNEFSLGDNVLIITVSTMALAGVLALAPPLGPSAKRVAAGAVLLGLAGVAGTREVA